MDIAQEENETDRRFLGNAALSSGDFVHRAIEHANLIINVGHDMVGDTANSIWPIKKHLEVQTHWDFACFEKVRAAGEHGGRTRLGDGGFMMNSQELETAVRLNMNLVVLILRDGAYGMIK